MKAFEIIKYIKTALLLFNIYDSQVIPGNLFLELCRNDIEDTAVPFPYTRLIVGTRQCRVLISGNINSDATGIDIT